MITKDDYVYISGKVTGTTDYIERFNKAEQKLIQAGYKVINPVRECQELGLTEWEECMRHCLSRLKEAKAICLLKDWQDSDGANIEYKIARQSKIFIFNENEIKEYRERANVKVL